MTVKLVSPYENAIHNHLSQEEDREKIYKEAYQSTIGDPDFLIEALKDDLNESMITDIQTELEKSTPDLLLVALMIQEFLEKARESHAEKKVEE